MADDWLYCTPPAKIFSSFFFVKFCSIRFRSLWNMMHSFIKVLLRSSVSPISKYIFWHLSYSF